MPILRQLIMMMMVRCTGGLWMALAEQDDQETYSVELQFISNN